MFLDLIEKHKYNDFRTYSSGPNKALLTYTSRCEKNATLQSNTQDTKCEEFFVEMTKHELIICFIAD